MFIVLECGMDQKWIESRGWRDCRGWK